MKYRCLQRNRNKKRIFYMKYVIAKSTMMYKYEIAALCISNNYTTVLFSGYYKTTHLHTGCEVGVAVTVDAIFQNGLCRTPGP